MKGTSVHVKNIMESNSSVIRRFEILLSWGFAGAETSDILKKTNGFSHTVPDFFFFIGSTEIYRNPGQASSAARVFSEQSSNERVRKPETLPLHSYDNPAYSVAMLKRSEPVA